MDVTLERILSLIPKKENGDYVHGAKKEFAMSIGYDNGQIVSMWENGSSSSYKKKLHEISIKYGVSVEWLAGETDERQKENLTDKNGEGDETTTELIDFAKTADADERKAAVEFIRFIKKQRVK